MTSSNLTSGPSKSNRITLPPMLMILPQTTPSSTLLPTTTTTTEIPSSCSSTTPRPLDLPQISQIAHLPHSFLNQNQNQNIYHYDYHQISNHHHHTPNLHHTTNHHHLNHLNHQINHLNQINLHSNLTPTPTPTPTLNNHSNHQIETQPLSISLLLEAANATQSDSNSSLISNHNLNFSNSIHSNLINSTHSSSSNHTLNHPSSDPISNWSSSSVPITTTDSDKLAPSPPQTPLNTPKILFDSNSLPNLNSHLNHSNHHQDQNSILSSNLSSQTTIFNNQKPSLPSLNQINYQNLTLFHSNDHLNQNHHLDLNHHHHHHHLNHLNHSIIIPNDLNHSNHNSNHHHLNHHQDIEFHPNHSFIQQSNHIQSKILNQHKSAQTCIKPNSNIMDHHSISKNLKILENLDSNQNQKLFNKPKQGRKKRSIGYIRPIILHRKRVGQRLLDMLKNAPVPSKPSAMELSRARCFPFADMKNKLKEWYGLQIDWPQNALFTLEELRSTRRMRMDELERLDKTLDGGGVRLRLSQQVLALEPQRALEFSFPSDGYTIEEHCPLQSDHSIDHSPIDSVTINSKKTRKT